MWLCKRAEPSSQVAQWLKILAKFSYRIEHRPGKKHGHADGLSRQPDEGCKQCLNIERRDGGPSRSELDALCNPEQSYDWDQGQLQPRANAPPEGIYNLRINPVLADNVRELQQLQETLPRVVADIELRRGDDDPARNSCGRGAPSYGYTANAGIPCGSGQMVY